MLYFTTAPTIAAVVAVARTEWESAFVAAVFAFLLALAVRSEWTHWREMIPPRHTASSN